MGAASAPARVSATACTKSQTKVTLGGKSTCVSARGYLPKPEVTQSLGTGVMRHLLTGALGSVIDKHFPLPKGATAPAAADAGVQKKAAAGVDPLVKRAIARATKRTTASALRTADVTMSGSESFTANGHTGTLTVTGRIPNGNDGKLDPAQATLDFTFTTIANGVKASAGTTIGLNDTFKWDGPCPDARGDLSATSNTNATNHSESQPGGGVDYERDQTNIQSHGGSSTTFKPTSRLGQISFHDAFHLIRTHDLSLLHGLYKPSYRIQVTASWTGTVDPQSGAVTLTSLTAFISGASSAFGGGGAAAAIAGLNNDPQLSEQWRQLAVDEGHSILEKYKEAEARALDPNNCANMTFDPAASDDLGSGAKVAIQGRVGPKDGGSSDSIWDSPRIERGQVKGLPGTSSASQPIKVDVTGGSPDSSRVTAKFTERASSRAGVAEKQWIGKQSGWLVTVQGPVSSQEACCWILGGTATATAKVVKQTVGGTTGFYGQGTFTYAGLSTTGNGLPPQGCNWTPDSVGGTASVTITPSADGSTLDVQVVLHDLISATLACPAPIGAHSVGGVLLGGYYLPNKTTHPHVTLPADGTGSAQITWSNSTQPFVTSGRLTVTAKPI